MKNKIIITLFIITTLSSCSFGGTDTPEEKTKIKKIEIKETIEIDTNSTWATLTWTTSSWATSTWTIEDTNETLTWASNEKDEAIINEDEKEALKKMIKDKTEVIEIDETEEITTDELIDDLSIDFDKELDEEILNLFK